MKKLTLDEFRAALKAQGVDREDYAFKCPMCGTIQSGRMLINAGAGSDFDAINGVVGFSCVGRFTGKTSPSVEKDKNHGCNWTLGGLFQIHTLEVITPDGAPHPHFEPVDAAEAQELARTVVTHFRKIKGLELAAGSFADLNSATGGDDA